MPSLARRHFIAAAAGAAGAAALTPQLASAAEPAAATVSGTGTYLVTLGTNAGPAVPGPRKGIATAVVVDGNTYLVDTGLGVVRQLAEAGLPGHMLRAVFFTHLHSDHVAELPATLLYQWGPPVQGFVEPVHILGPGSARQLPAGARAQIAPGTPGTADMVRHVLAAYAYDVNIRVHDEARPPLDDLVVAKDIRLPSHVRASARGDLVPDMEPFPIFEDDNVRVLATLVDHAPVFPSFGFRIETAAGTVALSGDTAAHPNVSRLATGADILVHEAVYLDYFRERQFPQAFIDHIWESHTTPEEVGQVAAAAGVPHVVLSHLAGVATPAQWAADVSLHYDGQVTVAADGQVFPLG
jgi:ribonuclease BN (tRNA processing enzyme)